MTTTHTPTAHGGTDTRATRDSRALDVRALAQVIEAMLDQYSSTLGEHAVLTQLQRCRCELDSVPTGSLPEMLYRLARQRLEDLSDPTHGAYEERE